MGLPEINIAFKNKAVTAIKSGTTGIVLVVLNDPTKPQALTAFRSFGEVATADWTESNCKYLEMIFMGSPYMVIAVRAVVVATVVDIAATIALFSAMKFNWLCFPEAVPATHNTALVSFINAQRTAGNKIKAVLASASTADSDGIVNLTTTGISVLWDGEDAPTSYTTAAYTCRIAGILAGLPKTRSSTYYVLDEIVDVDTVADPDAAIDNGELIIIFDGEKYKIGRGVTSFKTFTTEKSEDFSKIKIVEAIDMIETDGRSTFADYYVGKVNNSYENKQMFVGAYNAYLKGITGDVLDPSQINAIEVDADANKLYLEGKGSDTSTMTAVQIKEANTGSQVFIKGRIRPLDAMEDLDLVFNM